jgi:hypothetical protein
MSSKQQQQQHPQAKSPIHELLDHEQKASEGTAAPTAPDPSNGSAASAETTPAKATRKKLPPLPRYRKQLDDAADVIARIATFDSRLAADLGVAVASIKTASATMAGFDATWKPAAPTRNVVAFRPEPGNPVTFSADGMKKYGELFQPGETGKLTVIRIEGTEAIVHGPKGGKARVKLTSLRPL